MKKNYWLITIIAFVIITPLILSKIVYDPSSAAVSYSKYTPLKGEFIILEKFDDTYDYGAYYVENTNTKDRYIFLKEYQIPNFNEGDHVDFYGYYIDSSITAEESKRVGLGDNFEDYRSTHPRFAQANITRARVIKKTNDIYWPAEKNIIKTMYAAPKGMIMVPFAYIILPGFSLPDVTTSGERLVFGYFVVTVAGITMVIKKRKNKYAIISTLLLAYLAMQILVAIGMYIY